jgi:hypothetical protein
MIDLSRQSESHQTETQVAKQPDSTRQRPLLARPQHLQPFFQQYHRVMKFGFDLRSELLGIETQMQVRQASHFDWTLR